MIYTNDAYETIREIIGDRTIQVLVMALISMTFCQLTKFVYFSIKQHKLAWGALMTTGGMPSSHTASVITLTVLIGMFQIKDEGALDYSFAVSLVFAIIVIHDAMGIRFEASKHAKILNKLVDDEDIETKRNLGFGKQGKLNELLGHKGFEVLGGIIVGTIIAIIGYFIF